MQYCVNHKPAAATVPATFMTAVSKTASGKQYQQESCS